MATLPTLDRFQDAPEVRPLPSTGITRRQRYYEPVRLPRRPGLSLAGVRLGVTTPNAWGLPCCVDSPFVDMPSPVPRWDRRRDQVAPLKLRQRPSPSLCWVGSHIALFEACSAFTHVTACLLTESPKRPFPSKAPAVSLPSPPLRLLPAGATVAGWDLHPLKNHAFHGAQRGHRTFARATQTTPARPAPFSGAGLEGAGWPPSLAGGPCLPSTAGCQTAGRAARSDATVPP